MVVTSVARDDLKDGGASHFAKVIKTLKENSLKVEVLIPDYIGEDLDIIISEKPDVINHNIECVSRLYPQIRPQAGYQRSLSILSKVKESGIYTKSGFMVGLGESDSEVIALLFDLKKAGCDIATVGQYISPSNGHQKVERYVEPERFDWYRRVGEKLGFMKVFSGSFVRSSYKASEII
ncbi:MAG: lipoic acid synthetase [Candidatus Saganbacteria bacterium]|uniref:Lipoic acid synthetase n=1 Tax=Candidatus Saganbacteria bacterium TaxID=2575572 RepID=A0A833NSB2_UNCSA|nr:MAG: lipoic acid synthetase [Candidatus Saganbacteria bacterium]